MFDHCSHKCYLVQLYQTLKLALVLYYHGSSWRDNWSRRRLVTVATKQLLCLQRWQGHGNVKVIFNVQDYIKDSNDDGGDIFGNQNDHGDRDDQCMVVMVIATSTWSLLIL